MDNLRKYPPVESWRKDFDSLIRGTKEVLFVYGPKHNGLTPFLNTFEIEVDSGIEDAVKNGDEVDLRICLQVCASPTSDKLIRSIIQKLNDRLISVTGKITRDTFSFDTLSVEYLRSAFKNLLHGEVKDVPRISRIVILFDQSNKFKEDLIGRFLVLSLVTLLDDDKLDGGRLKFVFGGTSSLRKIQQKWVDIEKEGSSYYIEESEPVVFPGLSEKQVLQIIKSDKWSDLNKNLRTDLFSYSGGHRNRLASILEHANIREPSDFKNLFQSEFKAIWASHLSEPAKRIAKALLEKDELKKHEILSLANLDTQPHLDVELELAVECVATVDENGIVRKTCDSFWDHVRSVSTLNENVTTESNDKQESKERASKKSTLSDKKACGPYKYNWATGKIIASNTIEYSVPDKYALVIRALFTKQLGQRQTTRISELSYMTIANLHIRGILMMLSGTAKIKKKDALEKDLKQLGPEGHAKKMAEYWRRDFSRWLSRQGLDPKGVIKYVKSAESYRVGTAWDILSPVLYQSEASVQFQEDEIIMEILQDRERVTPPDVSS